MQQIARLALLLALTADVVYDPVNDLFRLMRRHLSARDGGVFGQPDIHVGEIGKIVGEELRLHAPRVVHAADQEKKRKSQRDADEVS